MDKNPAFSQTKRHILETAQKLFVRYNYSSVSMNSIANELKLSKPALYHHFKNKEDLYMTILHFTHEQYMGHIREIIADKELSLTDKFRKIIGSYLNQHNEYCKNKSLCSSLILMQKMFKHHKNISGFVKTAREEAMNTVEPLIKEIIKTNKMPNGADPKLMFLLVTGAMNAYLLERTLFKNGDWTTKQVVEHLVQLVFKKSG